MLADGLDPLASFAVSSGTGRLDHASHETLGPQPWQQARTWRLCCSAVVCGVMGVDFGGPGSMVVVAAWVGKVAAFRSGDMGPLGPGFVTAHSFQGMAAGHLAAGLSKHSPAPLTTMQAQAHG